MKKRSLRFKLIFLFTLLMIANAAMVTFSLYQSLKNELISRDDNLLVNRADQLAKLIKSGIDIKTLPMYFQRMMDMREDIIYITDQDNQILVDTNSNLLVADHLNPIKFSEINLNAVIHWETQSGTPVSAIKFEADSPIGLLNVVIAKASVVRHSVLTEYLKKSVGISIVSILFMVVLSFWLIKGGLRDIRLLSRITAKTDLHALGHHVNVNQLPEELKSLGDSLNIMRSRLKDDFIRLTQLADDLAHELRTPINAIKVQNEIILQQPRTSEEYQSIIASNIEELDTLAKLIENTLFIARVENKNIALNKEPISLSVLINDIFNFFSFYAEDSQITLVNESSDVIIEADKVLLMRAFMNLISNAIKYSYPHTEVIVQTKQNGEKLIISISNQGDPPSDSSKVFTRFWRGDNARTTEGNGLGLPIVQAIMTLHDAEVHFTRIGDRNVFSLYF